MNVKKTIKKIVALGTGATMVGATVMGAMATLDNYPAPFVEDGVADVVVVVGADAKTSDTLGAIDIAASLQASAVVPVEVSGAVGRTTVVGDSVEIGTTADLLEVGEFIGDVKETITETDLDALQGGSVTTDKGSTVYNQYLRFDEGTNIVSGRVLYEENEDDVLGDFLKFANGDVMWEYHLEFEEGLESDIDSAFELEDLEDENLMIFGQDYAIVDTTLTSNGVDIEIELLGGDVVDTLEEGETKTYTVDGVDYEVTAVFISNPNSGSVSAKLSVNGELTDEMSSGETDILSNGLEIGVREILVNDRQGIVEFYLGANKIELSDSNFSDENYKSAGLEVTSESIDDASVQIKASFSGGNGDSDVDSNDVLKVTSIKVRLEADPIGSGDVYVPAGHGVREFLDEPQGMLNPTWDVRYEGLMDTGVSPIEFRAQGDHGYNLIFTNNNGLEYDIPLAENQDQFQLGDRDTDEVLYLFETCAGGANETENNASCYPIDENNYFVLTDDNDETGVTHVLKFDGVESSDSVITFEDLAGSDKQATYTGTPTTLGDASGQVEVGGKSFDFFLYDSGSETYSLCMDLDDSGNCTDNGEAMIVVKGGGILNFNSTNNTVDGEIGIELTTLDSEFDENGRNNSGSNETINITIQERANNEIGLSVPSGSNAHVTMVADPDDSDYDRGLTYFGVFLELNDPTGSDEAEGLVIEYPHSQRGVQVFVTAGTVNTIRGGSGSDGAYAVNPVSVGLGVLDTEVVGQVGTQPMIVVGGPCVNTVAMELMGNPVDCAADFSPGKATIKLFESESAILVAGYSAQDTLGAAYVLADFDDYPLSGTEVEVVVADLNSISVNVVE